MKVFVVGTARWFCDNPEEQKRFEDFKKACKNIGAWLSKRHHIIIAGTVEPYADHWVIEGVKENFEKRRKKSKANITLYAADKDESHRPPENPLLNWLKKYGHVPPLSKGYWEAHDKALKECDIVLVIGGRVEVPYEILTEPQQGPDADNVAGVCVMAKHYYKPTVGLFHYGSHGRDINLRTSGLYESSGYIPEDNLDILNGPLDRSEDEKPFLKLLKLILKKNPLKQVKRRWILLFSLILTALWFLAFYGIPGKLEGHHLDMIFLTTLVASIFAGSLGGIVRFLIKKAPHLATEGSPADLAANITLGFIVGFTCSAAVLSFLSWLIANIDQSHINYYNMAQGTAILSAPISILVTIVGPEVIPKLKDFFKRHFPP